MDIRTDSHERTVTVFPLWARFIVSLLGVGAIATWYFTELRYAVFVGAVALCIIGAITANAWNRELKQDGYASLAQLYGSYLGTLFLMVSLSPLLVIELSGRFGAVVGVAIGVSYAFCLRYIAYRGVGDYEQAVETYDGPAVVYLPEGPYIEHTEVTASESMKED